MKYVRFVLFVVLMSLTTVAFAQSAAQPAAPPDVQQAFDRLKTPEGSWEGPVTTLLASAPSVAQPVVLSDAQPVVPDARKDFDLMKTLAGNWQGPVTTDDPAMSTDKPMSLSIRVASHGNALIHELNTGGPEVTVFYVDSDRLTLIHYCDFGNRPHLVARASADGRTVDFDLVDARGSNQVGHVSHAVFTMIDANHHIEDWTFALANGKLVHAHMDFKRAE
jgi:hypothetical protein